MPEEGMSEQERQDLTQVGRKIRRIRNARNLTQDELSKEADVQLSGKAVSRFERGDRNMKLTTFFAFASALQVTPNDISPDRLLSPEAIQFAELSDLTFQNQRFMKLFGDILMNNQKEANVKNGKNSRNGNSQNGGGQEPDNRS